MKDEIIHGAIGALCLAAAAIAAGRNDAIFAFINLVWAMLNFALASEARAERRQ